MWVTVGGEAGCGGSRCSGQKELAVPGTYPRGDAGQASQVNTAVHRRWGSAGLVWRGSGSLVGNDWDYVHVCLGFRPENSGKPQHFRTSVEPEKD